MGLVVLGDVVLELKINLDKREAGIGFLKAVLSTIPFAGPFFAEAAGVVIPNLKAQRVERLTEILAERLFGEVFSDSCIRERLQDPKFLDLFEDGLIQASRALSEERLKRIASFLVNGIAEAEFDYLTSKRMFTLFSELNDAEVAILIASGYKDTRQHPYMVLEKGQPIALGDLTPTERSFRMDVYDSYIDHLISMGLLKPGDVKQGVLRQYESERVKVNRPMFYTLSPLGYLMLKHVGGAIEVDNAGDDQIKHS